MNPLAPSRRGLWCATVALIGLAGAAPVQAQGQSAVITGRVTTPQGQPLQGANVYITELNISVGSNAAGRYTITVPAQRVSGQSVQVRVRSIGYKPIAKPVTIAAGNQTVDFALVEDVNRLDEVVVTGVAAGTAARNVPFAVSKIDSSQMPVVGANAVQQLQGKIAGATISQASGRPGAAPAVVLRGPTSINASGRNQGPLYIVDGILLQGSTPDLNPNDIESVEVVKGAAAASLYGARAGGGVINITTKTGRTAAEGLKVGVRTARHLRADLVHAAVHERREARLIQDVAMIRGVDVARARGNLREQTLGQRAICVLLERDPEVAIMAGARVLRVGAFAEEVPAHLARAALLGGDVDHPVRGFGSVERRRGRPLENVYGLDLIGIDVVES